MTRILCLVTALSVSSCTMIRMVAETPSLGSYYDQCDSNWVGPVLDVVGSLVLSSFATWAYVVEHSPGYQSPPGWTTTTRGPPDDTFPAVLWVSSGLVMLSSAAGWYFYATDCPPPDDWEPMPKANW